jgi:hypothetical protein
MKVFDAAREAHYQQTVQYNAKVLKLTRKDGQVFGFTALERALTYDDGDGAILYNPVPGVEASARQTDIGFKADNLETRWLVDDSVITVEDAVARLWHGATYRLMEIVWNDLTVAPNIMQEGRVGDVKVEAGSVVVQLLSLVDAYLRGVNITIGSRCRATLGDSDCGVPVKPAQWSALEAVTAVNPRNATIGTYRRPTSYNDRHFMCTQTGQTGASEPTWNLTIGGNTDDGGAKWETLRTRTIEATVDVVTDNRLFTIVYSGDMPDADLEDGLVTFLSPAANAGLEPVEIRKWTLSTRLVKLYTPMIKPVVSGDPVELVVGCQKDVAACLGFKNIHRLFHAFPHVPGRDQRMKIYRA